MQYAVIQMTMYKEMKETFQNEYKERSQELRTRLARWNGEPPVVRLEKPTNIARARELGYKAKQGVVVARVRVVGGKKKRPMPPGGRKPSKYGRYFSRRKANQAIAEERAARRFSNCEVLNSYFVGTAGSNRYFEIILLDRSNPSITSDNQYAALVNQKNRALRGLTSAGRSHRGIIQKGFGTKRFRPSKRQNTRD
jgi:large subunit ribosomal protein L15e